ncbi:MAG: hypothetical protein C0518_05480 [Opitutus sp.]|nr:hypothetical protein [Opitutus sp.]
MRLRQPKISTELTKQVSHSPPPWADRLKRLRATLQLSQDEMAERLGVSRVWLSYLENAQREVNELLQIKIERLEKVAGVDSEHVNPVDEKRLNLGEKARGVEETRSDIYGVVASRFTDRKSPSTRKDCEDYFTQLMDAADLAENPNAFPVLFERLKRQFPLDEWPPPPPPAD